MRLTNHEWSDAVTPEDHQLITGLFDRMRSFGVPAKDGEAEALINQSMRATPDAPYMLVQSVLVQERALQQASTRIEDLEENLRLRDQQGQASGSGSFLGGLFGGTRPASERRPDASVPEVGQKAPPSAYGDQSPWGRGAGGAQQPAPAASGGFLQSAMSTAAGVAGGVLAAGAIRDLLGGSAQANPLHKGGSDKARQDHEALARQDAEDDARADQDAHEDAQADAADNQPDADAGDSSIDT
jgi:uncharacterized protein